MDFNVFLKKAKEESFWTNKRIFCFKGENYPSLFFYLFLKLLERDKLTVYPIKRESNLVADYGQLCLQLDQSILGQYNFYWLGDVGQAKSKVRKKIVDYLFKYQNSNQVAFFIPNDVKHGRAEYVESISISDVISYGDFKNLAVFFEHDFSSEKLLVMRKLFSKVGTISLDFACSLLGYLELVNVRFIGEFFDYFSRNLKVEPSLFQLSEYFFSMRPNRFFKLWSTLQGEYSEMFWLAYWSEQIWRAYYVTKLLRNKEFARAKKMSFRLPHSYIKQDWKRINLEHLSALYKHLYSIDFAFKKGVTCSGALDLWYCKHFLR